MSSVHSVLLLEDDRADAAIVTHALTRLYPHAVVEHVESCAAFLSRLAAGPVDVVVSDSSVRGCEGLKAFHLARERNPHVPFVYLSGWYGADRDLLGLKPLGVAAFLSKHDLSQLGPAIDGAVMDRERTLQSAGQLTGVEQLLSVMADLWKTRTLPEVAAIVRRAACDLIGADGAAFVMRDGETCYCADEGPDASLWKGQRLPLSGSLSGWAMAHRQPAVATDLHDDPRVVRSWYEPTYARAAVVVPIQAIDPVGAIEAYWAESREPHPGEVRLLQALADTAATALINVGAFEREARRANERSAELDEFVYAISHDLRAPIRHVHAFAEMLVTDHATTADLEMRHKLDRIAAASERMRAMIDALVELSRASQAVLRRQPFDLAPVALEAAEECQRASQRHVDFVCPPSLPTIGDPVLVRTTLKHLLANAWKFTRTSGEPRVEIGMTPDTPAIHYVRDNGVGFDEIHGEKLFALFHSLEDPSQFGGTGAGLTIARRLIQKHGGRIWAKSQPGAGATFFFSLE